MKSWYIRIFRDGESEPIYREAKNFFGAINELLSNIKKDVPFSCEVDFVLRKGSE